MVCFVLFCFILFCFVLRCDVTVMATVGHFFSLVEIWHETLDCLRAFLFFNLNLIFLVLSKLACVRFPSRPHFRNGF